MTSHLAGHADRVEAYLARLGVTDGPLAPTPDVLARLHLAHLTAVPFENLSIHAGEVIRLDPGWLYDKIVGRRRGGFCYELNGLFAELLAAIGFRVERLAGRVFGDDGSLGIPFDHMCLRVDGTWLADVGFGDSFVRPLRFHDRGDQGDGRRTFRIADDGPGACVLHDAGRPVFRFELAPFALADFQPGCDYHQTSPDSHFTRRRVVSRLTVDGRITLRDDRLITTATGGKTESPIGDSAEWRRLAAEQFGLVDLPARS
jgi:N-hydroxyarylamine O-acetyltransferase